MSREASGEIQEWFLQSERTMFSGTSRESYVKVGATVTCLRGRFQHERTWKEQGDKCERNMLFRDLILGGSGYVNVGVG